MVKVGDVCPLFFSPVKDKFGLEMDYIQRFHTSDRIHIQVFANASEEVSVNLNNLADGTSTPVTLSTYSQNDNVQMYYAILRELKDSVYTISVNGMLSEPFMVCSSDTLLDETLLVRYSHKSNNSPFDNIFWIDDAQQVFNFRMEAGFKPNGYSPQVSNEQYRNQMQEIEELYSIPYDIYNLTIGNSSGVPYWYAKLINRILCLSLVEIDGTKYVRSESSVPEMTQVIEDSQLFQISVSLELQNNDIAGIGGTPESGSSGSFPMFKIDHAKDGEMLQYSAEEAAFINTDKVEV
ncbi:hypothetical protein [Bacteroides sp. OM08-17BH]|uniref:hypothetical protein n=1 Tax=Bacteroides sp. OM08-17BH TaxID=2292285 RepID=UPI000E43B840|nr:hypothetical protein [Bacteroides sp. OM08-17BH]